MKLHARNAAGPLPSASDGAWQTAEGDEIVLEVEGMHPAEAILSGVRLSPVSVKRHGDRLLTRWTVPIHTWAGRAEVEVTDGLARATAVLDVRPHPGKLGLDAFREMLDELTAISPNLPWGLSQGSLNALRATGSPSIVHPAVLVHELPALLDALARLRRDPLVRTQRARAIASLRQARHVDTRSLAWLCAHPRPFLALTSPLAVSTPTEIHIDQRRTTTDAAHPATCHIRFLVERIIRLVERSARALTSLAGRHDYEDREHAAWLADRLRRSSAALAHELTLAPLSLVPAVPAGEGAAQALVDHPVYGRVQRTARRLLDPGARVSDGGPLQVSARRTHELFELLVFFRAVDAMRHILGDDWTWQAPPITRASALDVLPDDSAFVARRPDGKRLELRYQPTFSSYRSAAEQSARHSLSGERRPDTVVALFENDSLVRWLVLDAKYRASRQAIHDGLADLHVYRDALRWHGQACAGGFIIIPACESSARIYTSVEYVRTHRFGALRPVSYQEWFLAFECVRVAIDDAPSTTTVFARPATAMTDSA